MSRTGQKEEVGRTEVCRKPELLLSAIVALGCVMAFWLAAIRVALPYQLDYEEGNILNAAVRITRGDTPYPPPGEAVYILNPYGPLFYELVAGLVKWFGVGFIYPRLLVVFSGVLIALLLALCLHRWTGSWTLGLTFGFIYLSLPIVRHWLFLLRVDLVGITFALAGLYFFLASARGAYLSVLLFLAALFCKYTLVAAPGACVLFLLARKEWRKAAWFATSIVLPAILLFACAQYTTRKWFGFHMFWMHSDPFSLVKYASVFTLAIFIHLPLVLLAVVAATRRLSPRPALLALIYLGFCSVSVLTIGKGGSVDNHLLEWLAALCLCAGLGYHFLRTRPEQTRAAALASVALAVFVLVNLPRGIGPDPKRAECSQAYAYVRNHPGQRILSENVGALVLAGKPILISNPFLYAQLVRRSGWSDRALVGLIRSNYFEAIILDGNINYLRHKASDVAAANSRWPISFVDALERSYRPARRFVCEEANVAFEPALSLPAQ